MIKFEMNKQVGRLSLQRELILLGRILYKEFKVKGLISIAVVDQKTIKALNKKYRGKNKATDILTFVLNDDYLGEIILGYDKLKQRAKKSKMSIKNTAIYLLIHGVCHIFGYTHNNNIDIEKMEKKEYEILEKIKLKLKNEKK